MGHKHGVSEAFLNCSHERSSLYQRSREKRGLFGGSGKLLIRLEDCLGHDYHGHAYDAKGVREVQRQLRPISGHIFVQELRLSISNGRGIILDK